MAPPDLAPSFERIAINPVQTIASKDKETAEAIADAGLISFKAYSTPVNTMMTPSRAIIGPTGTFSLPNLFMLLIISENATIIIVMAPAAVIRLVVSIKDRAATDAAIMPIAMAIIMIEPFTFWAPFRP